MNPPTPALPRLLFVTPTFPDVQGNGLAMRAGMWVEALAQRYRVSLLVVPFFARPSRSAETFARQFCEETFVLRREEPSRIRRFKERFDTRPEIEQLFGRNVGSALEALGDRQFDIIQVFRLYMSTLALGVAAAQPGSPRIDLDMDDIESQTTARFSALQQELGNEAQAAMDAELSRRFASRERELMPRFDRIYVCSRADATTVEGIGGRDVRVVPNAVRRPSMRTEQHPAGTLFRFLFVGNLSYFPNVDGVHWFCHEVMPVLRARAESPFQLRIVGAGAAPSIAALASLPGVEVAGEVASVSAEYEAADSIIVPVRAGGGTRIKVLEAFAHQRPVVSTAMGAEGIEIEAGRDLLLADDAEAFAASCLQLMTDEALRRSLTRSALTLVTRDYSQDAINRLIAGWS